MREQKVKDVEHRQQSQAEIAKIDQQLVENTRRRKQADLEVAQRVRAWSCMLYMPVLQDLFSELW